VTRAQPSISIVVEWENVRLARASRARAMLERLCEEIQADRDAEIEVLLVHDGHAEGVAEAKRMLVGTGAEVRSLAVPGAGYYELKNQGAREARRELVVFVDCDVVPERGWLREIVTPFADPTVLVVAGETYLDPVRTWDKCLAPTLVFPHRGAPVTLGGRFFANNLAFRRETAIAFPFPSLADTSRASCVALARQLAEAGVQVAHNPAARASHPVPLGIQRTVKRALVHGRDTAVLAAVGAVPPATAAAGIRRVSGLLREVLRDRTTMGLPARAIPVALVVALSYYGLVAVGAALARVAPAVARRLDL
jgi:hypothetical protein